MSINVAAHCTIHGSPIEIFRIGNRRFCAQCISSAFAKQGFEVKMKTVDDSSTEGEQAHAPTGRS